MSTIHLSVLASHLENSLFGLLRTSSIEVVTTTLDDSQRRLWRRGEELDVLSWDLRREHRVLGTLCIVSNFTCDMSTEGTICTHLQPVHGALDISHTAHESVPLQEVDGGHAELLTALLTAVHLLDGVDPERDDLLTDGAGEAQARHHAAPDLVHNEIGVYNRPLLQERSEVGLGVPAAVLARAGRLIVHGCAERQHAENLSIRVVSYRTR